MRGGQAAVPSDRVSVVASFYPLAYFAQEIGGGNVAVINLTPAGAEPHDYEPTPRDVELIQKSRLLLLNGAGFEPWAERLRGQLAVRTVMAADEAAIDPHLWLDPVLAQEMARKIGAALSEIDPDQRAEYERNSADLLERLSELDREFRSGLSSCRKNEIITAHNAFAYLAARYGLRQVAISGLSPDEEPTPRDLAEVALFARENQVKYIFFETLLSPRLAETIAREVGAQTLVFNPLESLTAEEQLTGADYFSLQRANLENLRIALDCQ